MFGVELGCAVLHSVLAVKLSYLVLFCYGSFVEHLKTRGKLCLRN
jgi:hypothetical protein